MMNDTSKTAALFAIFVGLAWLAWQGKPISPALTQPVGATTINAADYDTLQEAVDALPKSGGVVQIPPGEYEIYAPVWLTRGNTRIQGAGPSTHIINRNQDAKHALILEHKDRPKEPLARLTRVEVANLRISGNPKSGDGMFIEGVKELYIEGVTVEHNGEHGIRVLDVFQNPRIVTSSVHDNGLDGLYILSAHDLIVSGTQFQNNRDGISAHGSTNVCVTGNSINDHRRHGIVLEDASPSVISGNIIEECAGQTISLSKDSRRSSITGNVFTNNGSGVVLQGAVDIAISGNTFADLKKPAVNTLAKCERVVVVGNAVSE